MSDRVIELHRGSESLEDAVAVRQRVFVEEQGVPEDLEMDGRDADALHLVAYDGDDPIGTARLRTVDAETAKAERVAVLPDHREEGLGRELVARLEDVARDRGIERIVLHAQTEVEEFYHRLGYETVSDVFEEAGIPHVEMEKSV